MRRPGVALYFTFCALLTSIVAARAAQSRPGEADRLFARALQLHRAGDVESAVRDYQAVLAIDPTRADARANLGAAYAGMGRYEDAIQQYNVSLALDSENASVRFNLALAYYKAARLGQAAQELARVLAAQPGNANATMVLADCHLRLGEHKKVIELLSPLEGLHGNDRAFAYMLGTALIEDGRLERGQQLIDRILRDGDSAEAELLMGIAFMKSHDYPTALKRFEHAVRINPGLPGANSLYGQALMRSGDSERAVDAFLRELETNPNDFESNLYLGILFKRDQKNEQALRHLERSLLVRPAELNVRYFLGSLYLALERHGDALKMLEGVVKEEPVFVEAHVSLATVYYRLKRKADGDRERAIILKLNAEQQSKAPGAREGLGPAYRGEKVSETPAPRKPDTTPPQ